MGDFGNPSYWVKISLPLIVVNHYSNERFALLYRTSVTLQMNINTIGTKISKHLNDIYLLI